MPLDEGLRVRLSKKMAGLLRHYGEKYGLKLGPGGWVTVSDLVAALRRIPGFQWVEERHVLEVVERDDKGRYELKGGMIRARYGHSVRVNIDYEEARDAPGILYHGTVARNLPSIRRRGLLPGKRLWVHLSASLEDAASTGRRHGPDVVVLAIDTSCLGRHGYRVYKASPRVYLVERVPPDCIKKIEEVYG